MSSGGGTKRKASSPLTKDGGDEQKKKNDTSVFAGLFKQNNANAGNVLGKDDSSGSNGNKAGADSLNNKRPRKSARIVEDEEDLQRKENKAEDEMEEVREDSEEKTKATTTTKKKNTTASAKETKDQPAQKIHPFFAMAQQKSAKTSSPKTEKAILATNKKTSDEKAEDKEEEEEEREGEKSKPSNVSPRLASPHRGAPDNEDDLIEDEGNKASMFVSQAPKADVDSPGEARKHAAHKLDLASSSFDPFAFAETQLAALKNSSNSVKSMPYLALATAFDDIEKHTGKGSALRAVMVLSNLFRSIIAGISQGWTCEQDLLSTVYLSINKIAPPYEGLELGVGEQVLMKAISSATGTDVKWLKKSYQTTGDLGSVAQTSKSSQRTLFSRPVGSGLTIDYVFKTFKGIAAEQGHSSQNKKIDKIKGLLINCREVEPQYIIRSLQGKLRIGVGEKSVLASLARAFVLTPPPDSIEAKQAKSSSNLDTRIQTATETLKNVFCQVPIYDHLIPNCVKYGIAELPNHCFLTAGLPVHPMLAQPTKGISEVLDRFTNQTFTCEFKYDGERAQIHRTDDGVDRIYSRNLENNTGKYPDIIQNIPHAMKEGTKSFIIDCEAVAWDKVNKKLLPFQVLSTRQRKVVELEKIKVPVIVYAFDLLYLNGRSLINEPLKKRRELLREHFQEVEGEFAFAKSLDTSDVEDIQTFLGQAVENQCEGLMVKSLDVGAEYTPSRRSYSWLKVKKDYLKGMTDSLDLVPIGAYLGRGKRKGVYGAYLLACYDDENEEYQSVCKIGTGFSDEMLEKFSTFLKDHIIREPRPYYRVELDNKNAVPDVWFDAVQVWEVLAADISISPLYKAGAGLVDASKGLSLRFPRFIQIREDKNPEDATTSSQVAEMYRKQASVSGGGNSAAGGGEDDDDLFL